jgi:hypothetical protein
MSRITTLCPSGKGSRASPAMKATPRYLIAATRATSILRWSKSTPITGAV